MSATTITSRHFLLTSSGVAGSQTQMWNAFASVAVGFSRRKVSACGDVVMICADTRCVDRSGENVCHCNGVHMSQGGLSRAAAHQHNRVGEESAILSMPDVCV